GHHARRALRVRERRGEGGRARAGGRLRPRHLPARGHGGGRTAGGRPRVLGDGAGDDRGGGGRAAVTGRGSPPSRYEIGRPGGSSRTDHSPELKSLKNTWPLWGCAPQTFG